MLVFSELKNQSGLNRALSSQEEIVDLAFPGQRRKKEPLFRGTFKIPPNWHTHCLV
jgi:hypothetical protein